MKRSQPNYPSRHIVKHIAANTLQYLTNPIIVLELGQFPTIAQCMLILCKMTRTAYSSYNSYISRNPVIPIMGDASLVKFVHNRAMLRYKLYTAKYDYVDILQLIRAIKCTTVSSDQRCISINSAIYYAYMHCTVSENWRPSFTMHMKKIIANRVNNIVFTPGEYVAKLLQYASDAHKLGIISIVPNILDKAIRFGPNVYGAAIFAYGYNCDELATISMEEYGGFTYDELLIARLIDPLCPDKIISLVQSVHQLCNHRADVAKLLTYYAIHRRKTYYLLGNIAEFLTRLVQFGRTVGYDVYASYEWMGNLRTVAMRHNDVALASWVNSYLDRYNYY